jgi:hypothetical protein
MYEKVSCEKKEAWASAERGTAGSSAGIVAPPCVEPRSSGPA